MKSNLFNTLSALANDPTAQQDLAGKSAAEAASVLTNAPYNLSDNQAMAIANALENEGARDDVHEMVATELNRCWNPNDGAFC